MNKTWTWCVIALLSLGSAAWAQDKNTGGTEKNIAALEEKWLQSQKANHPDMVAPLLADKFVSTNSDGKVTNKAQSLADAKKMKYDSVDYEDLKVTAFGDTAIATGGFKAKGTGPEGKALDLNEQCIASHSSAVKM